MNIWEVHPALVHFPIALLLSGVALDLVGWWRANEIQMRAATWMLLAGVATGILAANFGLLAFYTVPAHTDEVHQLMYWHLGTAVASLFLFTWVAIVRWVRRTTRPSMSSRVIGVIAAGILIVVGNLGGYIVYRGGAGVDPELLASAVREGHSHGQDDSQDMQGMKGMDHGEKGKTQDKDMKGMDHGAKGEGGKQPAQELGGQKQDSAWWFDNYKRDQKQAMAGKGMAHGEGGMGGMTGMTKEKMDTSSMAGDSSWSGMGKMKMASSLPGSRDVSRLYHIGESGFFLNHPEHITLTITQQAALNRMKQKALLSESTAQRKIEEAEHELWDLTGADEPDAAEIEAKIQEIEKLRGDQRMALVRAVGDAAKLLTDEQRQALLGTGADKR